MRVKRLLLTNFASILNGTGKSSVELFFNNDQKFIRIDGKNGSGKSSILNNISPKSRSNVSHSSTIIEGKEGLKEIDYIDGDTEYYIRHVYRPNSKGGHNIKSFFSINDNGDIRELNENGNVTEFNHVLNEYFSLSKDFLSLMSLGINSKGFVEKTSAERKKFIAPMIDSSNELTKKFKERKNKFNDTNSKIKLYTTKISNLGDTELLMIDKTSFDSKLDKYNNELENLNKDCYEYTIKHDSILNLINELPKVNDISKLVNSLTERITNIKSDLTSDYYNSKISDIESDMLNIDNSIQKIEYKISSMNDDIVYINNEILRDKSQINPDFIYSEFREIESEKTEIDERISRFESMAHDDIISVSDCTEIYNILYVIKESIDNINGMKDVTSALASFDTEPMFRNDYDKKCNELSDNKIRLESYKASANTKISNIDGILELKECDCVNCPVINKLIEVSDVSNSAIAELESDIIESQTTIDNMHDILKCMNELDNLANLINQNKMMLNKIPRIKLIVNSSMTDMINLYANKDIHDINDVMELASLNEQYEIDKYNKLAINDKYYSQKEIKINNDTTYASITRKELSLKEVTSAKTFAERKLIKLKHDKLINSNELKHLRVSLDTITNKESLQNELAEASELLLKYNELRNELTILDIAINDVNDKIVQCRKNINIVSLKIKEIDNKIYMYETYKDQLKELDEEYRYRQCIDDALSPTKGLPLLPMERFIGDIQSSVNDIINSTFPEIQLDKFIINSNEFTIPYTGKHGSGADIAYSSGGESAMISLAFTLTFLRHASPVYNIVLLDEFDATLDAHNKMRICDKLDIITEHMGIEQVFLISHNYAFDQYDAGIISLSENNEIDYSKIIFKTY